MDWKKTGRRILLPHPVLAALISVASIILLTYSFIYLESADPVSIAAYVLSFYALVLVSIRMPDIIRFAVRFRRENKYVLRYASDVRLRINVSLISAFAFNAVYAVFQLALGLWHHSVWFYAMAVYYLLLAMMRLMLMQYTRTHTACEQREAEWRKYRLCGVCLLLMTLALAIIIIYFVWKIREFKHHEITTIAMAAYTFASLALAIVNAVRYRSYGSPAYSAAKAISLVSAVVSMLILENAMFTAFGADTSELLRRIMLGATGVAVVFAVQGIAVYMIVNAGRKLRSV